MKDDDEFMNKVNNAAETFKTESKKGKETECAIITYLDIITWLEKVIRETEEGDFKIAVKQYKEIIDGFYPKKKTE